MQLRWLTSDRKWRFWWLRSRANPKPRKCDMAGQQRLGRAPSKEGAGLHFAVGRISNAKTLECRRRREFFTPLPESTTTNGAAAGRRPARRGGGGGARRRAARPAAGLKAMRVDGNGLKARWGAVEGARQGAFAARPREATPKQPSGGGKRTPRDRRRARTSAARLASPTRHHAPCRRRRISLVASSTVRKHGRSECCAREAPERRGVRVMSRAPRRRRRCVALRRAAASATATELRPRRRPCACGEGGERWRRIAIARFPRDRFPDGAVSSCSVASCVRRRVSLVTITTSWIFWSPAAVGRTRLAAPEARRAEVSLPWTYERQKGARTHLTM